MTPERSERRIESLRHTLSSIVAVAADHEVAAIAHEALQHDDALASADRQVEGMDNVARATVKDQARIERDKRSARRLLASFAAEDGHDAQVIRFPTPDDAA